MGSIDGNQVTGVSNLERLKIQNRLPSERTTVKGLKHQDELISSGKSELFQVGTGFTAPERFPSLQGFVEGKRSFYPFHVTAAALLNVNADRRLLLASFSETLNEKDQELLFWKRQGTQADTAGITTPGTDF